jgi:AraC-like DNA-binding protein
MWMGSNSAEAHAAMIVGYISDPYLRAGLVQAGHREEDVVLDRSLADEALACGHPRLVMCAAAEGGRALLPPGAHAVPVLVLTEPMLAAWEAERLSREIPISRVEWLARRLRESMEAQVAGATWVDRALGDLGRAAGAQLPTSLRGFARRVMEFPSHYDDLQPIARACGVTRGALKARFRRRGLPSPSVYLRWFRMMAVSYALSDRTATVAQVASRMGFTSDGNLCRAMRSLTRQTPTEVRTVYGWNRLLIRFAWTHLGAEAVDAWHEMGELFLTRAA